MKNVSTWVRVYLITILFCICFTHSINAQYILAGQTTGENIYYFNIEDIHLADHGGTGSGCPFDIDNNASIDLTFDVYHLSGGKFPTLMTKITPLLTTSLSTLVSEEGWIRKHLEGDTIGLDLNWFTEQGLLHYHYNTTNYGDFFGTGYVGFKIDEPDFILGWFKIDVSFGEMTLLEYAFYSETYVGLNDTDVVFNQVIVRNPVYNILEILYRPNNEIVKPMCRLLDINGNVLMHAPLNTNKTLLNVESYPCGLYILEVSSLNGYNRAFKVIKL